MAVNEKQINDTISKQVQNQIAQQKQAINNSLGIQKTQYDETINRNKAYLTEQIGKYDKDKLVTDDRSVALQNRRGGFYSGGLDYQLAENARNTTNAKSALTRDINDKNSSVLGEYNTLARQAAENIRQLEMQAPDLIRQRVLEEMTRQRQLQMQEEQWALEKQLKQLQLQQARRKGTRGPGGSPSGATSAEDVVRAALKEVNDSIHVKMGNSSPKLNPNATTGLASQPGSYWYARGYGSQYLPNNYSQSKGKNQTGVR
jgi:hypothetical protein